MELPAQGNGAGRPSPLIASTFQDDAPQYSPDGNRIAFSSRRSGSCEIWVCDRQGRSPVQLTRFGGPLPGSPRWSPDGKEIAFDARKEGNADIYVMDADGGRLRRLTVDETQEFMPSWSRDGRWLYFASNRTGTLQIWKMPASGGPPVQITKQGGLRLGRKRERQSSLSHQGAAGRGDLECPDGRRRGDSRLRFSRGRAVEVLDSSRRRDTLRDGGQPLPPAGRVFQPRDRKNAQDCRAREADYDVGPGPGGLP